MTRIINLCDHPVHIRWADGGGVIELPAADVPAQVIFSRPPEELLPYALPNGSEVAVRLWRRNWIGVRDLPDPQPDTLFVVSAHVARLASHRPDLVVTFGRRNARSGDHLIAAVLMRETWP